MEYEANGSTHAPVLRFLSKTGLLMTSLLMLLCALMAMLEIATITSILPLPAELSLASYWPLAQCSLASWLPWFIGAPLVVFVGIRFRPRSRRWLLALSVHAGTCATMIGLGWASSLLCCPEPIAGFLPLNPQAMQQTSSDMAASGRTPATMPVGTPIIRPDEAWEFFMQGMPGGPPNGPGLDVTVVSDPRFVPMTLLLEIPLYAVLAVLVQAILAFGELKDRSIMEASLRAQLSQSQLNALRTQVRPHFLFNALNGVSATMSTDVSKARSMLSGLAQILRASYENMQQQEITLDDEVNLAKQYMNIQCVRFGDRLTVSFDVSEDLLPTQVPILILQPLLENSIVHAVETTRRPCRINVRAWRSAHSLHVEVVDDGAGSEEADSLPSGVGLSNTRARIAQLYGPAGTVVAEAVTPTGHRTVVTLPLRARGQTQ